MLKTELYKAPSFRSAGAILAHLSAMEVSRTLPFPAEETATR